MSAGNDPRRLRRDAAGSARRRLDGTDRDGLELGSRLELVYQGSSALFGQVVTLEPGETTTIAVEHTATVTPGLGFGATTGA
jgi:hypothetical protein